jgi:hypothetical protein
MGLRLERECRLGGCRVEGEGGMLMHNLPSAVLSRVAHGRVHPRLHRRMVLFHASEAPEPVGESDVPADGDPEVPRLRLEGGREVSNSRS